ncbi:MAG: cytochrome c1, partial [Rhizobium sp.]|nr:cytochrome c1 [Rhizobium sp.]
MKKLVTSIALIATLAGFSSGASAAEEGHGLAAAVEHAAATSHYPILKPHNLDWSFAGPFGKYD